MTSMAPELFRFAENNGKMLYIVASKQEQVEKAVEIFKERYPKLSLWVVVMGILFRNKKWMRKRNILHKLILIFLL